MQQVPRLRACDLQGHNHRAHEWRRSCENPAATQGPIEVVRRVQRTWAQDHPEQLLKWSFPTKRRDCFHISFRAIERMETCAPAEFKLAFTELVGRCPPIIQRTLSYLYLNYLHPHHNSIPAQGRHLLMLKVYESKSEAHIWFVPVQEVHLLHKQAAEVMRNGVSLNDVQLVETYVVESTLAVHCETFTRGGQRGNDYGECTWIGGVTLHIILEEEDERLEKSLEFSGVPETKFAEMTEKGAKMREKRARKKANQRARRAEVAANEAAEERQRKEQTEAAENLQRKEGLVKPHESLRGFLVEPHESLRGLLESGPLAACMSSSDDDSEDGRH